MAKKLQNITKKGLLGVKLGMTQVWDEKGFFVPVSVVKVDKNVVTNIKNVEKDGYSAVQLGFGEIDPKKVSKPLKGQFDKIKVTPRRYLSEYRTESVEDLKIGAEVGVEIFEAGTKIDVSGTTKGHGFAGVMKRHGFHGVSSSHGAHINHRKPGSIGACATPARVFAGLRMAGRMGGVKQTTLNLKLQAIDEEKNYLLIKGAIPGSKGGLVLVTSGRTAEKKKGKN
jgi:large subunit ribosomal protein L3